MSWLLQLKNLNISGEKRYLIGYGTTIKLPSKVSGACVAGFSSYGPSVDGQEPDVASIGAKTSFYTSIYSVSK